MGNEPIPVEVASKTDQTFLVAPEWSLPEFEDGRADDCSRFALVVAVPVIRIEESHR
jgi:hypothetical protein